MAFATCLAIEAAAGETIRIRGSASLAERLGSALAESLVARYGDLSLEWEPAGAGSAFNALFEGTAHFAITSRNVEADEIELARRLGLHLREVALGLDGIAVVVHPDNGIRSLSLGQLESLYARRIVRWLGVGGINQGVRLLGPSESSGAWAVFRDVVFRSDESFAPAVMQLSPREILENVAADPGAVGFLSMSYDRSAVRTVAIVDGESEEGMSPDVGSIASGTYPLRHGIWLYTVIEPEGGLRDFLTFLFLHDGARLMREAGLVPVPGLTALLRCTGPKRQPPDVSFTRIGFGFRGSRLGRTARQALTDVAERLGESQGVWVTGHAEPTENGAGEELAIARARAVADFLENAGVEPSRIVLKARGTLEPMSSNDTLDGRRSNRRADVWILREP